MFSLMGNCVSWIQRKKQPTVSLKIVVVGLDNAGKTSTIKSLKHQPNNDIAPTIGFSSENLVLGKYDVTLYDLGGGPNIRSIWVKYLAESYGVIFVVDASDHERKEECKEVLAQLLSSPKMQRKPILLLANKQDKSSAMDEADICDALDLEKLVNQNECPCRVELTAVYSSLSKSKKWGNRPKTDKSVDSGFKWLLAEISTKYNVLHPRIVNDMEEQKREVEVEREKRRERVRKLREQRELEEAKLNQNDPLETERQQPDGVSMNENKTHSSLGELVTDETVVIRNNNALDSNFAETETTEETNQSPEKISPIVNQSYNENIHQAIVISSDAVVSNLGCEITDYEPSMTSLPGSVAKLPRDQSNLSELIAKKNLSPNSSDFLQESAEISENSSNGNNQEKLKKRKKKKKHKNQVLPFMDENQTNPPKGRLSPLGLHQGESGPEVKKNNLSTVLPPISSSASSPRPNMESDGDIIL